MLRMSSSILVVQLTYLHLPSMFRSTLSRFKPISSEITYETEVIHHLTCHVKFKFVYRNIDRTMNPQCLL